MMFSSPFFSGPATSRFSPRPQYVYRDSPQAYYDSPFEVSDEPMYSRPSFLQRPHPSFTARPAARHWCDEYESSTESPEESSEDEAGEPQPGYFSLAGSARDTCTCGRCHEPAARPAARRLLGNGMPAGDARRGIARQGKPAATARPATRASAAAAAAAAERLNSAPPKRASNARRPEVKSDEPAPSGAPRRTNCRAPAAAADQNAERQAPHSAPAEPERSATAADGDDEQERGQVLASFTAVMAVAKEIETLRREVEAFSGAKKTKEFLRLEDTLTRVLLRLDTVESHGDEKVRSCRRKAVVDAQLILELLESRVAAAPVPDASSHGGSAVTNDLVEDSATPPSDDDADDSATPPSDDDADDSAMSPSDDDADDSDADSECSMA